MVDEQTSFLLEFGFEHKQGPVYFSVDDIDAVECVTIAQDLAAEFDWLTPCVKDIRMLRIEDEQRPDARTRSRAPTQKTMRKRLMSLVSSNLPV